MISLEDCIALCGLSEKEVLAIAEHEHVPEVAAAAIGRYLLKEPTGAQKIRDMMRDDIHDALSRGDREHASELLDGPEAFRGDPSRGQQEIDLIVVIDHDQDLQAHRSESSKRLPSSFALHAAPTAHNATIENVVPVAFLQ